LSSYSWFIKYPKIYRYDSRYCDELFDDEVEISLKKDGSNFRFSWTGTELVWGSRKVLKPTGKPFNSAKEYVEERAKELPTNWIVFGEVIGGINQHRIVYKGIHIDVVVFDVYDIHTERFLPSKEWMERIKSVGFNTVEILDTQDVNEALDEARRRNEEGIVIKNYSNQVFGKAVLENFKAKKSAKSPLQQPDKKYERMFLIQTVTEHRVSNIIHALQDEGKFEWSMKSMPTLIKAVYEDIIEEELVDFIMDHPKIDSFSFKHVKKALGGMVAGILKSLMTERRLKKEKSDYVLNAVKKKLGDLLSSLQLNQTEEGNS